MTDTRNRRCWNARLSRAQLARQRARRRRAGWLLAWLLFALAFLSPAVVVAAPDAEREGARRAGGGDYGGVSRSVSPFQSDAPNTLRPRWVSQSGRYGGSRPSLARLLRDLRRPAARREAADMLLARLPAGEVRLRDWVAEQLSTGSVTPLATWARSGMPDGDIIAAWRGAARREAESDVPLPSASPAP